MAAPYIGTGVTVTWSGFTGEVVDITPPSPKFEALKSSYQGTTTAHTFLQSKLYDGGDLKLDVWFDPAVSSVMVHETTYDSITLTIESSTWTFNAFVTGYEPTITLEELMKATITLKVTGAVTVA
jgi:hypothetical protein